VIAGRHGQTEHTDLQDAELAICNEALKRRVWRKVHLGIGGETLKVRTVEVTGSDIGDAPMLPGLLAQVPADQDIASVTADGACDTRKCHDAIAERGAVAILPPRKNASRCR
jgi:hypothetical protein